VRIGLDFDNTIVSYDRLFHKVALERALIPADLPQNKLLVRDYLRKIGQEDDWTEMQGLVYGARMDEADIFEGCLDFLRAARQAGCTLFIISHKTARPFRGPPYDLHKAARHWVENTLNEVMPSDHVFFEVTKDAKLGRAADCRCDIFVDDLPEILLAPGFPPDTRRILFDPEAHHPANEAWQSVASWQALRDVLEPQWPSRP